MSIHPDNIARLIEAAETACRLNLRNRFVSAGPQLFPRRVWRLLGDAAPAGCKFPVISAA